MTKIVAVLSLMLSVMGANEANAALIKGLEFNVDGVLPSADSDILFFNSVNGAEGQFTVAGGFLQQRTFGIGEGSAGYVFPDFSSNEIDPMMSTTLEARIRINRLQTAPTENSGGVFFQAFDGVNGYRLFFDADGIRIVTDSGFDFISLDTSMFRKYRLESPGSSSMLRVFIDDILVLTTLAQSDTRNLFNFGDGITRSGNNGDADWDFVRLSQSAAVVPIPATVWLFFSGLGFLGWMTRHKKGGKV